jgi:hypothetical protein
MAMAAPQPLDATLGGTVAGARGSSLTAGPGAFVDASGKPVTGTVQVSLTSLSPAVPGELAAYPGALVGSVNGAAPSLLQTFGVLEVTVTQSGQTLQLAAGQTVTVTIPVVSGGTLLPTRDLWSFNLATGIWDHEGTAQLAGSAYTAQLTHFSYHNIDTEIVQGKATCVTGIVVDKSGNPVAGAYVSPQEGATVDWLIQTDSNGRYCTWVLSGASETITADATQAPFGEGSINVTAGAGNAFPDSYPFACSNLGCQSAPNIVLDQPPCATDSDCPSDDVCCTVSGHGMCLELFACMFAGGATPTVVDGGDGGGSSIDAGGGADGPYDGGVDAAPSSDGPTCNDLTFGDAQLVSETVVAGAPPPTPPAGGAIVSGTYVLSSATYYDAGTGCPLPNQMPLETGAKYMISASSAGTGTLEELFGGSNGDASITEIFRANFSYTITGTSITTQEVCVLGQGVIPVPDGGGPTQTGSYTATATELTLYTVDYNGNGTDAAAGICGTTVYVLTKE